MIKTNEIDKPWELSRKASRVRRYHAKSLLIDETVGHHTFNVLGIIFMCVPVTALRWQLLAAVWQHDVAEGVTGDVPSPVKREMDFAALERKVLADHDMHDMGDYLYAYEKRWLKIADLCEGWMKSVEEFRMGNLSMAATADRYRTYANDKMDELEEHTDDSKSHPSDEVVALRKFRRLISIICKQHHEAEDCYATTNF